MNKHDQLYRNQSARRYRKSYFVCALSGFALAAGLAPGVRAHETDQYSVPVGRQFADLRAWYSEYFYDRLAGALDLTNQKIARTLRNGQPTESTAKAQSADSLAWNLLIQFPPVIHYTETLELQLKSGRLQQCYPGLIISYIPLRWIYHHPFLLLDPTKLPRLSRSSTIMVNGSYFGTDKVVHFVHMGYLYFVAYQKALARGEPVEVAVKKAINEGAGNSIISEKNMLGFLSTGVISNGDKAANYVGMKMYLNLSEPVMLQGAMHPPLWVRDGAFYRFNSHVRRDTDFFSVFVSDHYNEVFNPNQYAPGQAQWVMSEVRRRCTDVLDWYRDPSGRANGKADFRRKAEELMTYYGEDYGWAGNLDEMVSVMTACFDGDPQSDSLASRPVGVRDSLGRTALWRAARQGQFNEVQSLLRVESAAQPDVDGETPLHAAVRSRNLDVVRALLQSGTMPTVANKHGMTPLHLATQENLAEIVDALLAGGADVEARDTFGCTPLHDAARKSSPGVVARLLRSGASVRAADTLGTTPLHRAARADRTDIVRQLLAAGADPSAVNSMGRSAIDDARAAGHRDTVAVLEQSLGRSSAISERSQRP